MKDFQEIKTFQDVVLVEMQREKKKMLSFHDIYEVCADAARCLPEPVHPDRQKDLFMQRLFEDLRHLAKHHFIFMYFKDGSNQLTHITLGEKGEKYLKNVMFTHTYRLISPDVYDANKRPRKMAEQAVSKTHSH